MLGNGSGARAHPFVAPCGTPSPRPRTDRTDSTRDMPGGHDNAHAGAGPTGITLNDLHVAAPERTSEPLSINRPLPATAAIRLARQRRHVFTNLKANLAALVVHAGVLVAAVVLSGLALDHAGSSGLHLPPALAAATGLPGVTFAQLLLAPLAAVLVYFLLEALPVLVLLRQAVPFKDTSPVPEDATVADVLSPRAGDIHFGKLKVSYSITGDALVARSLGDRLVAVYDRNILSNVSLGSGAAFIAWRGRHDTPPVVVDMEADGYASRLIIHGAHFEGAGVDEAGALDKARKFRDELQKILPTAHPH